MDTDNEIITQEQYTAFIKETLQLRQNLEEGFLELGARLAKIRNEELYKGHYDNFKEFLEDARLTESFASRLITIHTKLVEDMGVSRETLVPIGWSSLYQIAKYTDDKEETQELLQLAQKVRRQDLEDELRERKTGCTEHDLSDERIVLAKCKKCGTMVRIYED